jgi:hypothetical protein
MKLLVVRGPWSVVSRQFAAPPVRLLATDAGRRTTYRPGISLLEVLISIFILSVGMLSIASLLPVGGYQAQKATIEDRKSVIGQNAFHEFRTRGMANAENWMGFPLPPGQTFPKPVSVAIDPLAYTAPAPVGGNASKQFPRASANAATAPAMLRVGLKFINGPTADVAHQVAQQIFMSHDDTVFEENAVDPDAPALSKWEADASGQPIRRQFTGDYSWLATLTPVYFDLTPKAPWVWPAEYHLSLAIFFKRNLRALANEQGVAYERQVPVKQQSAADLAGFGLGGGELLLLGSPDETNVRPGNWVMVCGRYGDPAQGQPVFRWYRVATVGAFESDQGARPVTLAGPDWIGVTNQQDPSQWQCKPSHVAIFEGCVGVFEKTVHLEGPSVWSNPVATNQGAALAN